MYTSYYSISKISDYRIVTYQVHSIPQHTILTYHSTVLPTFPSDPSAHRWECRGAPHSGGCLRGSLLPLKGLRF